jgi:hypothetical protein
MREVFLGDTDTTFTVRPNAWQSYGFNIDGKVTTPMSTDVCMSPGGSMAHDNPPNGVDNAFGKKVVPFFSVIGMGTPVSRLLSDSVQHGVFTVQFDVVGLTDDATQTNTGLSAKVYSGLQFDPVGCTAPTFTKSDVWPIDPSTLMNPTDPKSSKIAFTNAYIVGGTWVNGAAGDVDLTISVMGIPLALTIHKAQITFQHDGTHLKGGIIGGVLATSEFIDGLTAAGKANTALAGALSFVTPSIMSAADILTDGTNVAGKPCDGISIGIGFDAEEIGLPTKIGTPGANTCETDGGAGDGGGQDGGGTGGDAGADGG